MTDTPADLVDNFSQRLIGRYGYAKPEFPHGYDAYRPAPPAALLDVLCLEAQVERPPLVVDLGSGTGLSTRPWSERADEVVGVEASAPMLAGAERETPQANVRYVHAFAQDTGLAAEVADVVTCSQSFHWMEPEPTLAEVARILRPGGVFAAYDYDWPPVVNWEIEAAFEELWLRIGRLRAELGHPRHPKSGHLERIRASGHFRYAREVLLHGRDRGSAERVVGMALSLGPLVVLLEEGVSEEEVGLARLRETAAEILGDGEVEWFVCYRVRLGVK